jgi:O-antigen/teichoic acid export membrane protein
VVVIISRILEPSDYGIIGLLTVFSFIGNIIVDSGFGQALIQKGDANNKDYSTVFFLNISLSIIIYLILYFSSPFIANFYDLPILEKLSKIVFLTIPINAISLIHNTMLESKMEFKKISLVSIISVLISGVIGIILAYRGYGVMSLVYQLIVLNLSKSIILFIQNHWLPNLEFSIKSLKQLLPLSLNLLGTGLIIVVFNNVYTLLIGKFYSTSEVGFYTQAKRFNELAGNTITGIVFKVSFPGLVKFKENLKRLKLGYEKIIKLTIFIIAPLMFLLIAISDNLFLIILTEKWLPASPLFRLLCIYSLTFPLHQINTNILKVVGKGRTILFIEIIRRIILVVAIIFTIYSGVEALLIGQIAASLIIVSINMYYSGKQINYTVFEQIRHIAPYYLIGVVSYLTSLPFQIISNNLLLTITFQTLSFSISYLILNRLFRTDAYLEIINIINEKIFKRIRK